ncbi:MAG: hypothetical protein M9962_02330 [Oligoflexia bacterium]|nr:hypothetical protein [Oligoflexia bacterium]
MKSFVIEIFKEKIIRRFAAGGILSLIKIICGFLRVKTFASLLGVAGVGVISQGNQFHLTAIALTSLSMAVGIINRIREPSRKDIKEEVQKTQGTALSLLTALISIYSVVVVLSYNTINTYIFNNLISASLLIPILIAVPFSVIASGYFEGIFFSRDRYDLYVKASSIAAILDLASTIVLTYLYGLKGAFISIGLSSIYLFLSFLWKSRDLKENIFSFFHFSFDLSECKKLLNYCLVMVVSVSFGYVATIVIRSLFLQKFGSEMNGLLQVSMALSAYSLPFITNGLWGHMHPTVSSLKNSLDAKKELEISLRIVLTLSTLASGIFLTIPEFFIKIVYNHSFLPSMQFFPYQFLGDFFYCFAFTVSVYTLALSKIRVYLLGWLIFHSLFLLSSYLLLPIVHELSVPIAYLGTSAICASLTLIWLKLNDSLNKQVLLLALLFLTVISTSACLLKFESSFSIRITFGLLVFFVMIINIKKLLHRN